MESFDTLIARLLPQGLLRVRGRPAVAYDQQGLVFSVAMEGGAVKLFDVRSFDKVSNSFDVCGWSCSVYDFNPFDTSVLHSFALPNEFMIF